jgi:hypothetical protein
MGGSNNEDGLVMQYLFAVLAVLATIQVASAQGVQQPGFFDKLQAEHAPGAYAARMRAQREQATYKALLELGATDKEALAGATNPQFLQALLPLLEARRQSRQ